MIDRLLRYFIFSLAFTMAGLLFQTGTASADAAKGYRLGAGDVLSISVWKDESLTRHVTILPDGTITFPLIGKVKAEGKQLNELKPVLCERLAKFVPDPILSLEVMQVNSLKIYVIGKVTRPGRFQLLSNIDVLQALSLAGGLNSFAKSSKIKIFKKSDEGTRILAFDYDAVSTGEDLAQNILLDRGDVIVVP